MSGSAPDRSIRRTNCANRSSRPLRLRASALRLWSLPLRQRPGVSVVWSAPEFLAASLPEPLSAAPLPTARRLRVTIRRPRPATIHRRAPTIRRRLPTIRRLRAPTMHHLPRIRRRQPIRHRQPIRRQRRTPNWRQAAIGHTAVCGSRVTVTRCATYRSVPDRAQSRRDCAGRLQPSRPACFVTKPAAAARGSVQQ